MGARIGDREHSKNLNVLPIPVYLVPDDNVARYVANRSITVGATWAAEIQRAPLTRMEQILKRCFDVVGAAFALLLLSPLMLLTTLFVKVDSFGPAFFFQTRNGFNGRKFRIIKFRTMHVLEDGNSIRQVTRGDPRVTRLGRWLRRANIDELPQLFNVLNGEMSLIGPRPHAVAHNSEFEKLIANYAFRNHVRPGVPGLGTSQRLSGRNTDRRHDGKTYRTRSVVYQQLEPVVGYHDPVSYVDLGSSSNRLLVWLLN